MDNHGPSARDDNTHCELKTVVLRPDQPGVQGDDEPALDFRATISLLVNHEFHVDLPLRTSPVFIGPPRCYPSDPAGHAMHARQVEYYQVEVWLADRLTADNEPSSSYTNDTIIFIDVTGEGTETLARAWCSTHGRNAVVRP
ncbi:hypothetical protein BJX66DRAFT_306461 [Aspergillus keveii]|uniref:Uncharacterized protein n=1 Tax=Aspergillus keveii TaxID=714993 RepID=A0ABR4G2P5_9EURO